jgi:hypothetical protein
MSLSLLLDGISQSDNESLAVLSPRSEQPHDVSMVKRREGFATDRPFERDPMITRRRRDTDKLETDPQH